LLINIGNYNCLLDPKMSDCQIANTHPCPYKLCTLALKQTHNQRQALTLPYELTRTCFVYGAANVAKLLLSLLDQCGNHNLCTLNACTLLCTCTQVEELLREALTLSACLTRAAEDSSKMPAGLLEKLLPKRAKQYQKGISGQAAAPA